MTSKQTKTCDDQNTGDAGNREFGGRQHIAQLKPGFDPEGQTRELETGDDQAFPRSEKKDIPQESLADRIGKSKEGDKP